MVIVVLRSHRVCFYLLGVGFYLKGKCYDICEAIQICKCFFGKNVLCALKKVAGICEGSTEPITISIRWLFPDVTVLLSLTVFMNIVSEIMPTTSDAVPLIGKLSSSDRTRELHCMH